MGPRQDAGWVKSIVSTMAKGGESVSEGDMQNLTVSEKALVTLVQGARKGSLDGTALVAMLESTKDTLRALVDLTTESKADPSGPIRPVDAIHQAGLALEAVYHTSSYLTDNETRATCKTHLAEIATLVNHLSRSMQTVDVTAASALQQGLASLGSDKVEQMLQAARDNVARSGAKVLGNLRDALRDACDATLCYYSNCNDDAQLGDP